MAAPTPTPPLLQEAFLAVLAAAVSLALLALLPLAALALWDIRRHPLRAAAPVALAAVALQLFFVRAPAALEWRINHARAPLPARYAAYAAAAPPTFRAADLHCDALLWRRRDLLARGTAGHVDVPRLVEGAFAIQVFALVVSVPRGLNVVANAPPSSPLADHIFAKAVLERWPLRAWASQLQRALVQCARLHQVAAASGGRLVVARTAADLRRPPAGTDAGGTAGGAVRGVLALEGAGALEGRLENVDVLFDAGLRVLGPTHFFDTEVGGSLSGVGKGGLSTFGRRVVARMKELHMTVDVAHASHAVIEDLAAMPQEGRPCVFLSHTGIRSVCESQRNVDDEHLRLVAEMGGIVGVALFSPAVCDEEDLLGSFVKSVARAISVVGVDRVALGSDFDGAVVTSVDASQSRTIFGALVHEGGLSREHAAAVMYGNTARFLQRCLPP